MSRYTDLELYYQGVNISTDLQNHLLSWNFTDNLSGQADDLQITLEDNAGKWSGAWMPEESSSLTANIVRNNWEKEGQSDRHQIGKFEIDEVDANSPPSTVTIKATSIPQSSALRGQNKNRAWEKTHLSVVAKDVASKDGLKLFYDTDDDPLYDRIEQTEETDLTFLTRLCNDEGLSLKISNSQIVILDESKYEAKSPIATIDKKSSKFINYQLMRTLTGTYKACKVEYQDPKTNKLISYTFTPKKSPKTSRILVVNQQVDSQAQAIRLAKKSLRDANKTAVTVSLTIPGDIKYFAGFTVTLKNWGWFDGKYIITQSSHSKTGPYETALQLRQCLEGY